jgi:hypothetical protein
MQKIENYWVVADNTVVFPFILFFLFYFHLFAESLSDIACNDSEYLAQRKNEYRLINPLGKQCRPHHESFTIVKCLFVLGELQPKRPHNRQATCAGLSKESIKVWQQ